MVHTIIPALYDSQFALPKSNHDYLLALEDIEHFSLSPQIFYLLKQRGKLENTPPFFQQALKQQYHKNLYLNTFIKKKLEQILTQLEEAQISVIPLKGVQFAEKYFGDIGARGTSDIDLLIKHSDLEKAKSCIRSLGFTLEEELIPSHFHASFSKPIPHSPIPLTVELHWDLLKKDTSQLNIEDFWSDAKLAAPYRFVKELSDYHTFYMICLHGWRHQLNSVKYFLDILQVAHVLGPRMDYERLWKDASNHKTLNRVQKTLAIVYSQFPDLCPIQDFPSKVNHSQWWEYKAIRHSYYKTYKQYVNLFCFEFLDYDTIGDRYRALRKWLIPPKDELAYEIGSTENEQATVREYLRLYKNRNFTFWKSIIKKNSLLKSNKS